MVGLPFILVSNLLEIRTPRTLASIPMLSSGVTAPDRCRTSSFWTPLVSFADNYKLNFYLPDLTHCAGRLLEGVAYANHTLTCPDRFSSPPSIFGADQLVFRAKTRNDR